MKLFLFLIIIQLNAFTPGKWSYLDKFTIGKEKNGPISEIVKNKSGQVLYSASYEYNPNGKLIREKFSNSKSEFDGEILYTYESDKLVLEELYSPAKELIEKKQFFYNQKEVLKEVEVTFISTGKKIKHRIFSMNKEMVIDCETRWEEANTVETFSTRKESLQPNVLNQEIFDDKLKQVALIKTFLDKDGRIEKRENHQPNTKKQQVFTYDENSKLVSISFHVKQDENWQPTKTHFFNYGGTTTQNSKSE